MDNLYDIINIKQEKEVWEHIYDSIVLTTEKMNNIKETNSDMAAESVSDYLTKNHVSNKMVSVEEVENGDIHSFVLVPKDTNEYYLIDLVIDNPGVSQIFTILRDKGCQVVNDTDFNIYMSMITGAIKNYSMDDLYITKKKTRHN